MDAAHEWDGEQKATRRLADIAALVGDGIVNRWRQRLAEINSGGTLTDARHDVQNVQNVQNGRASLHFAQIEQIEQRRGLRSARLATATSCDCDIPNEWSEAIIRLLSQPCPDAESAERWACASRGLEQFARAWAAKAIGVGWTFDELFALCEPFANTSLQGGAWFVSDATVTAITADAITLRTQGGATQRIYRKCRVERLEL
jgi:hypothetical protein